MNNIVVSHTAQPGSSELRRVLRNHSRVAYHGAILTAAESILLRHGFKHTKMADVAEATGVSVGTLYNYFQNKEAVLQAIVEQHYERLEEQLALPFDSTDPREQLAQLIGRVHEFIEENRDLFQLYFGAEFERHDSPTVAVRASPNSILEKISLRTRELLGHCLRLGRIRSDIPLNFLAWSLEATLKALLSDWYRDTEAFSLSRRANEIVSLFFSGAQAAS